jgi:hypothetical protein
MGGRKEGALMPELQDSINRVGGLPGLLGPGQGGRKKKSKMVPLGLGRWGLERCLHLAFQTATLNRRTKVT